MRGAGKRGRDASSAASPTRPCWVALPQGGASGWTSPDVSAGSPVSAVWPQYARRLAATLPTCCTAARGRAELSCLWPCTSNPVEASSRCIILGGGAAETQAGGPSRHQQTYNILNKAAAWRFRNLIQGVLARRKRKMVFRRRISAANGVVLLESMDLVIVGVPPHQGGIPLQKLLACAVEGLAAMLAAEALGDAGVPPIGWFWHSTS